jgi:type I restriction enzyme S subunit
MSGTNFLERLLDGAAVEWKPLGEVTKYEQPTKYLVRSTNYSDEFETPVLTAGKTFILGYTDEIDGIYRASKNPVIIFDDFTTANKWVHFDFKAKSSAMKMITSANDSNFVLKFIYYWLNTLPSELIDGDHKRQWISNFCNKKIPIPCPDDRDRSLAIQAEIVRILDTFTALTARQKQYEYYRDLLLNFPKPEEQQ